MNVLGTLLLDSPISIHVTWRDYLVDLGLADPAANFRHVVMQGGPKYLVLRNCWCQSVSSIVLLHASQRARVAIGHRTVSRHGSPRHELHEANKWGDAWVSGYLWIQRWYSIKVKGHDNGQS